MPVIVRALETIPKPGGGDALHNKNPFKKRSNMTQKHYLTAAMAALVLAAPQARAQISITGGGLSYSQDFDNLIRTTTAETWANDADSVSANDSPRLKGLLGWYTASYTNATGLSTTYTPLLRAGDGGGNTGSFYSFGTVSAADRALGTLPSDGATGSGAGSFRIGVRFVNNTADIISGFSFAYTGEQWRKAQIPIATGAQNNQFVVSYATFGAGLGTLDSGPYSPTLVGATFNTPVDGGDNVSAALDGNLLANRVTGLGTTVSDLVVMPGEEIWLRWFDSNSSSADHGIAIDDFSVNFTTIPVPEPTVAALMGLGLAVLVSRSRFKR